MTKTLVRGLVSLALSFYLVSTVSAQSVEVEGEVESPVSASTSTVTASPTELPPDGIAFSTITITARNSQGDAVANKPVTVNASGNSLTLTCEDSDDDSSATGTTDSNGQLICFLKSTEEQKVAITVVVDTVTLSDQPTIIFVNEPTTGGGGTTEPPPTTGGGGSTEPPPPSTGGPPTTEPPTNIPPLEPTPSEPGVIQRTVETVKRTINSIAEAIPNNLPAIVGLATIIPTIAVMAPITTSISIALLGGIPGFQYLFFTIMPFFRSPRRWGIVRDAQTNVPIPGVFVSLHDLKTGKEIRKVLTDKTGRYGFLAEPHGQYWIEISSPLYQTYRSGILNGSQLQSGMVSFDIRLAANPEIQIASLKKVAHFSNWVRIIQNLQLLVLVLGTFMAIVLFAKERTIETILLVSLYALLWTLRSISSTRTRKFGLVKDQSLDTGLGEVVLQVTANTATEQSFVHSTISDEAGRFILLVPPGKYTVIGAKQGYHPVEKKIVGEAEDTLLTLQRLGDGPRPELSVY